MFIYIYTYIYIYIYIYTIHKMDAVLTKSKKPDTKYDARIDGSKTVSFGQKGASDFTTHKKPYRKDRYIYIYI